MDQVRTQTRRSLGEGGALRRAPQDDGRRTRHAEAYVLSAPKGLPRPVLRSRNLSFEAAGAAQEDAAREEAFTCGDIVFDKPND